MTADPAGRGPSSPTEAALREALLPLADELDPVEGPVIIAWSVDALAYAIADKLALERREVIDLELLSEVPHEATELASEVLARDCGHVRWCGCRGRWRGRSWLVLDTLMLRGWTLTPPAPSTSAPALTPGEESAFRYAEAAANDFDRLAARRDAVLAIDPGDHATSSRDYGRGFADAISRVRAALTTPTDEETTRG